MSVIRKTPYIESVIASLNADQLGEFKTLLNGGSSAGFRSLIGETKITDDDKAHCKLIDLELELGKVATGILIYTTTYSVLVGYVEQHITIYKLNITNKTYEDVGEYPTIEELRRICDETAEAGGDAWVEIMKDKIVYDEEDDEVQIGTNASVDGKLKVNELTDFVDIDGNPIIPDPLGHAGKFLKAGTTGMVWDNASAKLYRHYIKIKGTSDTSVGKYNLTDGTFTQDSSLWGWYHFVLYSSSATPLTLADLSTQTLVVSAVFSYQNNSIIDSTVSALVKFYGETNKMSITASGVLRIGSIPSLWRAYKDGYTPSNSDFVDTVTEV